MCRLLILGTCTCSCAWLIPDECQWTVLPMCVCSLPKPRPSLLRGYPPPTSYNHTDKWGEIQNVLTHSHISHELSYFRRITFFSRFFFSRELWNIYEGTGCSWIDFSKHEGPFPNLGMGLALALAWGFGSILGVALSSGSGLSSCCELGVWLGARSGVGADSVLVSVISSGAVYNLCSVLNINESGSQRPSL